MAATPAEARPAPDARAIPSPGDGDRPIDDPRALQILSTEHWSLLTARSLVYNEAFARGGMFLALLSATLVALGLVATATAFSDDFLSVVALVLALDLFVGAATLGRIVTASSEDIRYLQGMNRLRHAYFEIVPGLERYFITSGHDDPGSVLGGTYGPPETSALRNLRHGLTTMPGMIAVICCALAGMLAAVLVLRFGHDPLLAVVLGIATFAVVFIVELVLQMRLIRGVIASLSTRFPPGSDVRPPA